MRAKVCFVVTSPATALNFLRGYLSRLQEEDWDVTLVCAPGADLEEFAKREGVSVHTVPMKREPSVGRDLLALGRLTLLFRRIRPDLVIFATPKASFLSSIAAWVARVPARVYEQWGLRLEGSAGLKQQLLFAMEWVSCRLSTVVVANSPSLKQKILQLRLNAGTRVVSLGSGSSHGVNVERFAPDAAMGPLDRDSSMFLSRIHGPVIGFVGRLHPDKGVDILLEGFELAAREVEGAGLLLVGPDEGAFGKVTRSFSSRQVHIAGSASDPRPYFREMDILVLMSKREGFPNVVLEAAAMGVPAIVARSTGTVDSVVDGSTGIIVEVGDSAGLAEALVSLISNHDAREAMGARARERAVAEFAHAGVVSNHVDMFRKELSSHSRG